MWWHLAAGRLILERRAFVRTEPWSFAREGVAWLNHEWLSDVFYAAWAAMFGVESLTVWLLGIVTLTYLLLFDLLRRLTNRPAVSYAAAFLAFVLARPCLRGSKPRQPSAERTGRHHDRWIAAHSTSCQSHSPCRVWPLR